MTIGTLVHGRPIFRPAPVRPRRWAVAVVLAVTIELRRPWVSCPLLVIAIVVALVMAPPGSRMVEAVMPSEFAELRMVREVRATMLVMPSKVLAMMARRWPTMTRCAMLGATVCHGRTVAEVLAMTIHHTSMMSVLGMMAAAIVEPLEVTEAERAISVRAARRGMPVCGRTFPMLGKEFVMRTSGA
ncbi:MAG: hypothetical protein AB7O59_15950 [Pirellulales bacterium]